MSKQLQTAIETAIRDLVEDRGATSEAVALHADLMSLGCVIGVVSDDEAVDVDAVAPAATLLLEEAADSLEENPYAGTVPNRAAAARAALGLESGTQGKPLRGRRGQPGRVGTIARWLGYEPASVFKPRQDGRSAFDALVDDMAAYVVRQEIAYRIKERRLAQQALRPPLESAMRIDWLARFEQYYRIWNAVSGLVADLRMSLKHLRNGDETEAQLFARKALYYYTRFLVERERFIDKCGGLWVLPDPAAEQTVADATWMLRKPVPLTEVDDSVLRIAISQWTELATFVQASHRDAALTRLAGVWQTWLDKCRCEREAPDNDCPVHQSLVWADRFMSSLDAQWDSLADWYQVRRPSSAVNISA